MMPLTLAKIGESNIIERVTGTPEIKKYLQNLGFVPGSEVTIVSMFGGNFIVNVKDVRIAINNELAQKIML